MGSLKDNSKLQDGFLWQLQDLIYHFDFYFLVQFHAQSKYWINGCYIYQSIFFMTLEFIDLFNKHSKYTKIKTESIISTLAISLS